MIHFIVNPAAGGGAGLKCAGQIEREMRARGVSYNMLWTAKSMDAHDMALDSVKNGADAIAVVGGDGTIQEVLSAINGTGVPLGIIPAGSGNDFIASLDDYKGRAPLFYLEKILRGHTRAVDMIKCTAPGEKMPLYSINIASVGLDAEIVNKAADLKKIFGRFAYIASTVYNAFVYNPRRITIDTGDGEFGGSFALAAVCNGGVYGGGFKITPSAVIDDGLITLCLLTHLPRRMILALFPLVLVGKHTILKQISYHTCKKVTIGYEGVMHVNLDGNIFNFTAPLTFEILSGAVVVF